jgi:uncharacterized protein
MSLLAHIRDHTSTFVKYRDQGLYSQWRWRLVANNGKTIANSGEGYWNEADCDHAIALVKDSFRSPTVMR